ncbi:hypothetical protein [Lebetimonas sp. JH292]|uniref:hypothetical protein n=1 Tax=Lebetimonas sp. JH292 TaxID=990068 RepID=UPI0004BB0D22|nr:hypothetical protein [Lebetimonas sp. JH292]
MGKEYIGIGAGAVGFRKWKMDNGKVKSFRYYTQTNVKEFLKNPTKYSYEELREARDEISKYIPGTPLNYWF